MTKFKDLSLIAKSVHNEGVICYPTEGVWGLGCHPQSATAFDKLLLLKKRPPEKGVILIAATIEQIRPYVDLTPLLLLQLEKVWPGFVTCILPKSSSCPDYLCGEHQSIAVRLTAYQPLQALCLAANSPLVSTSANISGEPPVQTIEQAKAVFTDSVDFYVDGALGGAQKPSQIIAWHQEKINIIRK